MRLPRVWPYLLAAALSIAPSPLAQAASPGVSGALSIVPGLGQTVNGDALEGLGWFVTSVGLFLSGNTYISQAGYDLWQYNMYDAYRDAGAAGAAKHSVFENYIAAFNPLNIIDPIGAPMLAVGAVSGGQGSRLSSVPNPLIYRPITYAFVGLGEEGLFRGFLFPGLSQAFQSKTAGALVSSVLFAYFHITNGAADIAPPMILARTLMGVIFCIQTNLNKNDLRKSIFTHAWWDFLVTRNGGVQGATGIKINL